eukprot:Phypoly_transcript_14148.p1 GENE.Phypoly_transcript_14148~~Phypoly_transcript_14148.p1  ORF type:complete len:189 (+),score=34.05 Phypoly_transcript_14148:136-702(+)
MPIEVATPIPITTPAGTLTDDQCWQVFFLPKDDLVVPTSFIAFCPFTGVCAEGGTEAEAARNWKEEAHKQFNRSFYLPELHTTRKIWYGEAGSQTSPLPKLAPASPLSSPPLPSSTTPKSFYVIDKYGDTDQAVAFSPQSKDVIVGKGVEELSEVDNLPHFWSDWRVSCTPLLHNNWFFSLTPHCINW